MTGIYHLPGGAIFDAKTRAILKARWEMEKAQLFKIDLPEGTKEWIETARLFQDIIPAYRRAPNLWIFCPRCGSAHLHGSGRIEGEANGPRATHCSNIGAQKQYWLIEIGPITKPLLKFFNAARKYAEHKNSIAAERRWKGEQFKTFSLTVSEKISIKEVQQGYPTAREFFTGRALLSPGAVRYMLESLMTANILGDYADLTIRIGDTEIRENEKARV